LPVAIVTLTGYPEYPNIEINERNPVVNVGTQENPSYLPAEACVILPGQTIKRRLSPDQTQQMITFACRKPWENANSIIGDGKVVLGLNPSTNSLLVSSSCGLSTTSYTDFTQARYGITVSTGLITVAGRVLTPPVIKYKNEQSRDTNVIPRFGSWNMANVRFHTGSNLGPWTYILIRSNRSRDRFGPPDIYNTVMDFKRFLNAAGINANGFIDIPPLIIDMIDGEEAINDTKIKETIRKLHTAKSRPNFVLVILPYNDVAIYNSVKTYADTKAGLHTVCVVGSKFMKTERQEQYFGNISLKFNLKAGGINQTVDPLKLGIISEGKTMVVGIDVTHPSPGSKDTAPSVAGIVASIDRVLGQWPATFAVQSERRQEMVSSLEYMFLSRLKLWQKHNKNALPENVIIYRDGVSEGQYQLLLDQELPLIRSACRQVYPAPDTKKGLPKISIIVCGKRHHTRFYPTQEADADRSSNCSPGTVVDRGVTQASSWDFFLQPHACLQGTARPGHYYVILDEIFRGRPNKGSLQNPADALEDLTHNMCHLFGRATKAVSLCPPAFYADLLCTRTRCYLSDQFDPHDSSATASVVSGTAGTTSTPSTTSSDRMNIPDSIKDSMYYI
jgi:eukaryotic translation initiation factor 2C